MKFDTVIIGGGLAGLVCGIKLVKAGQQCVIISSGQSALHFLSGSFDLLNALPDGSPVMQPLLAVGDLIRTEPDHPYAKIGEKHFTELVTEAESFFPDIGVSLQGTAQQNHYRITPMGSLKKTWLTLSDFIISESETSLPWKNVTILNPLGFLDFYPQFIADEFRKIGTESKIYEFNMPDLDNLRRNPSELRSTNIARVLDKEENTKHLCEIIKKEARDSEAVILPACIGLNSSESIRFLEKQTGKPVLLIPTIPPSIAGIRMQQYLQQYFRRLGGIYMMGDTVVKAEIMNNRVERVYSANHGDIPFEGTNMVLASGSYFSRGLIATRDRIYEPVFDLDVNYLRERHEWYTENIFETQAYQQFGACSAPDFRAMRKGNVISNLYVGGAILEGFNPIKEGSGGGVSILTALDIADKILKNESVCSCNNL